MGTISVAMLISICVLAFGVGSLWGPQVQPKISLGMTGVGFLLVGFSTNGLLPLSFTCVLIGVLLELLALGIITIEFIPTAEKTEPTNDPKKKK